MSATRGTVWPQADGTIHVLEQYVTGDITNTTIIIYPEGTDLDVALAANFTKWETMVLAEAAEQEAEEVIGGEA